MKRILLGVCCLIAVGNPCHVLRPITQADHDYWQAQLAAA